jgi:hypothetical protein
MLILPCLELRAGALAEVAPRLVFAIALFLSNCQMYVKLNYKLRLYHFLRHPVGREVLPRVLSKHIQLLPNGQGHLDSIPTRGYAFKICFLRSARPKTLFHFVSNHLLQMRNSVFPEENDENDAGTQPAKALQSPENL